MAEQHLHVGDSGALVKVALSDPAAGSPVDVSASTARTFVFGRPDGTSFLRDAFLVGDGTDGVLGYLTQGADLDQAGTWRVQAVVVTPSWASRSDVAKFKVKDNLGG